MLLLFRLLQGCAFLRSEQPRHIRFFEGEEPYLPLDVARIARQAAVAPHDPMAGNDDADGIVSDSAAYGLCLRSWLFLLRQEKIMWHMLY